MKQLTIFALLAAALVLNGCGKDDAGADKAAAPTGSSAPAASSAPATSAAPATKPAMAEPAAAPMAMAADGATRMIDHTQDEIEFMLKKSLAGWESLREDVSDSEQIKMIDKEIAGLKSKLDAM